MRVFISDEVCGRVPLIVDRVWVGLRFLLGQGVLRFLVTAFPFLNYALARVSASVAR